MHECPECGIKINGEENLTEHRKIHLKKEPFMCEECGKFFDAEKNLNIHKANHQILKCEICEDMIFVNLSDFTNHRKIHDESCICEVCGKVFESMRALSPHLHTAHSDIELSCEVCEKTFNSRTEFQRHKKFHTSQASRKCNECGKIFQSLSNLRVHKNIHTNLRAYECEVCKKAFVQLSTLIAHRRIHTGEKPYECDVCNKKFNSAHTLKNHKRLHINLIDDDEKCICDNCNRMFRFKKSLIRHLNVCSTNLAKRKKLEDKQNKNKKFECETCKKCFERAVHLEQHRKIHFERIYICHYCDNRFNSKEDFRDHYRNHLDEEERV